MKGHPKKHIEQGNVEESDSTMRLQRFLASAGLGGRRECEEIISSGRISVDGEVVSSLGLQINVEQNRIEFDGELLKMQPKRYYMLNKPKGIICTNRDPGGRPKVIDLFPNESVRLFTVGRLDEQSEGLLIVTNDGEFSNKLAHPRYRIYRTYRVQVVGIPSTETLKKLREGFYFREGKFRVHQVRKVGRQGKSTFLEILMAEGQNREVRRLLARVGHKVIALKRTAFGPLKLGSLGVGKFRPLTKKEHALLADILKRNMKIQSGSVTQKSNSQRKSGATALNKTLGKKKATSTKATKRRKSK